MGALALYAAASLLLFGLPVLGESGGVIGANPSDSRLFQWALAWWPHALGEGLDPLSTSAIFAPDGYHLMWTSSVPAIAVALWPVTALFGPLVAYDVALLLAPALAAWTAFLLCRAVTGRPAPSLLGGWLFGFSSYLLATLSGGHLHAAWVWLFPLAALLGVRVVRRRTSARAYVALLALLLVVQLLVSTEMTLVLVGFGGALLAAAWLALPARRPALARTMRLTLLAGAVAALVASPVIVSLLGAGARPDVPTEYGLVDFLNPLFPTELTFVGNSTFAELSQRYVGNSSTRGGYLGVVLIGILVVWGTAAWRRRRREEQLLAGFGLGALVLALGPLLKVAGLSTIPMPWWPFAHLPFTRLVLTYRLMAVVTLVVAVAVAIWLARGGRRPAVRWAVALLAVAMLLPNAGSALYHHRQHMAPFFASGMYRDVLRPDDGVFALPYGAYGPSMAWQAEADFAFELVGGYAEPPPPAYELPVIQQLGRAQRFDPAWADELRAFLDEKGATVIVVDPAMQGPGVEVVEALGLQAREVGGVLVARL